MNRLDDRGVAGDHLERLAGGVRRVEDGDQHRRDVLTGDVAAAGLLRDRHLSRPRIVDEMTRPNDRPVKRGPRPDVVVRSAFRAQVRDEDGIACLVGCLDVGSHRGDHHIAADLRGLGGIGEQDRCVAVDRLLARRPAARARTRREHHRVGSSEMGRDIVDRGALEIDDHRFGSSCFEVGGVPGVSDEAGDRVAALREQPFEDQGDLAVSTGDDDAHVAMLRTAIFCARADVKCPETAACRVLLRSPTCGVGPARASWSAGLAGRA